MLSDSSGAIINHNLTSQCHFLYTIRKNDVKVTMSRKTEYLIMICFKKEQHNEGKIRLTITASVNFEQLTSVV